MDLFGRGYVIDHVISTFKRSSQREVYENYVTDMLRYIVNNTAGQESRAIMNKSYRDLIHPVSKDTEKHNDKKAQDIINKLRNKLKGG